MDTTPAASASDSASDLARAMRDALREGQLDDAQAMLDQLSSIIGDEQHLLTFRVLIAIQRGHIREALQMVHAQGHQDGAELKALCLHLLGDPSWHGEATALLDSPNANTRRAMAELLGMSPNE